MKHAHCAKSTKAINVVKLRNATLNVVKLPGITSQCCTSNRNGSNAKYTKATKVVKLRNATLNVVKLPEVT